MNRIMRNSGAALAAIFIAGSLTACGPGSASSSRSDTNPTEVSTDLGNKKYELTLWDGAGLKAVDEALIAGFEAKYPNITITGQYDPDNVSGQNGPRVISAKDAPDIARVTDMNSAVRGNHLVSLEAYVDAYGWDVPDSQTELYRVDSNGKLGSGDLYALPNSYSVTGIYFNTKLAEQLGIDAAPTSVEEFEADMQTAKDAGILPMMTYAKDGGTSFVFQALMANNSSAEDVQNWTRIQLVSATAGFGSACFDCSLAISSSHTSLGVLYPRSFMGVSLISPTIASSSSCVRSSKLVPLGR